MLYNIYGMAWLWLVDGGGTRGGLGDVAVLLLCILKQNLLIGFDVGFDLL